MEPEEFAKFGVPWMFHDVPHIEPLEHNKLLQGALAATLVSMNA